MLRVVVYDLRDAFDQSVLSPAEQQRVERFASQDAARRWAAGRCGLRQVLADAVGADPAALELTRGPHGKPALASSDLRFNKSDSGELAAVALSDGREVGLDVEAHRDVKRSERIAARFFSDAEQEALATLPVDERRQAFFDCWTVKEAVLKCDGGGLGAMPMASFSAPLGAQWQGQISARWWGARLQIATGVSGAVVLEGTDEARPTVTYRKAGASAPG
ncbi:MAG TPA: 4'-phosphopantetheinyl transferase superfamily protein [Acidimicrobiales bacterium]|nr:4'-phosphopantetheinyl transferase superfamily protein [Acidimicrobiales bacterium]